MDCTRSSKDSLGVATYRYVRPCRASLPERRRWVSSRSKTLRTGGWRQFRLLCLAVSVLAARPDHSCRADIGGASGDKPVSNQNWPAGADAVFNVTARVAYWEGPPFGGGQYHVECRGDARQLSEVLAAFDRVKAKTKRVVVHDGIGQSFWLNPSGDPAKQLAARIDWTFTVWDRASWRRSIDPKNERKPDDEALEPLAQIDVFTGGNVTWSDVAVPKGLRIVDERK